MSWYLQGILGASLPQKFYGVYPDTLSALFLVLVLGRSGFDLTPKSPLSQEGVAFVSDSLQFAHPSPTPAPTMASSLNAHDIDPNNLPRVDDDVHGDDDFPTLEELMKELGTENPDFDEGEEQFSDDDESWDEDIRPEDEDWEVAEKGKSVSKPRPSELSLTPAL